MRLVASTSSGPVRGTSGTRGARMRARALTIATLSLAIAATAGSGVAHATPGGPACAPFAPFAAGAFPATATIDNTYLPLIPGTQMVLEGVANRTGEPLPHRVTFTVTDLVKTINGVTSRVVWDVDVNEGQVAEAELAFFAEDNAGNVWNLGEYPEEFGLDSSGQYGFLGAPSTWIAGQRGAIAGVHMPGTPQIDSSYGQGFAPAIRFLDCATIVDTNAVLPGTSYQNVVVTHETSPFDRQGGTQTKSHAPGVGIVAIGALDDPEGETLRLVALNHLTASQMQAARVEALRLDERAYGVSKVYGATSPAVVG